ncbi:MAG TPA: OmpH family outer membrane protein [Candidatus Coprenecus pullistercoris]|nr:OmpH family outer membrane protein [Candidatus Coprenecus pullistercoris]
MKNLNLTLNIILLLAVAALYFLHFNGKDKAESGMTEESTGAVAAKGDIVYINLDSLVNGYDMFNDLNTELQSKASAIENDVNKQTRALENDIKGYQEKMQKGLLTMSQAQSTEQELALRDQELRQLINQKQMEMADETNVMYNRVMDAINTYVGKYNKDKQFSLILTTNGTTNTVLNGDSSLNITDEILKGLNEEYIKNRNKN